MDHSVLAPQDTPDELVKFVVDDVVVRHLARIPQVQPVGEERPGMEKERILEAIRRCAEDNGGVAVGRGRFEKLTGIREAQWAGRYWLRWSDAVIEAGYPPAAMNAALPDDVVLDALVLFIRELGHYPVTTEFRMRRRADPSFPDHKVYRRFGTKPELAARVIEHVGKDPDMDSVVASCRPIAALAAPAGDSVQEGGLVAGTVYLMKSGNYYKVGRSNAVGRRAYELAIQLPEKLTVIHTIETDDAVGIERYWHDRFGHRRVNGEWFALTATDLAAFRSRRKYM